MMPPERRNGLARSIYNRLAADARFPRTQISTEAQYCLVQVLSAILPSAYFNRSTQISTPCFLQLDIRHIRWSPGPNPPTLIGGGGGDDEDLLFAQDASLYGQFAQH